MNKRILKIFNEAGFHQPEMERLGIEHKFEKFAELLLRESLKVGEDYSEDFYHFKDEILKHFGVE